MNDREDDIETVRRRIATATMAWTQAASLTEIRDSFDALFAGASQATIEAFNIGHMPAAWIATSASIANRVVLFCHGGGFQVGSIRSHAGLMSRLADAGKARVLGFNYRLAPEHRYPAAADDAFAAYQWLLGSGVASSRIIIAGDSAGATLALSTALRARNSSLPLPSGLVLISPWLDLTLRGDSYANRAELDIFSKPAQLAAMARSYLGRNGKASDPSVSPIDADLTGLPPILIHAGDHDITVDDAFLLAWRARSCAVNVEVRVWDSMFHHFQMFGELRQSKESLAELGRFITQHTGGDAT
jgi:acetyl esterase/lipase